MIDKIILIIFIVSNIVLLLDEDLSTDIAVVFQLSLITSFQSLKFGKDKEPYPGILIVLNFDQFAGINLFTINFLSFKQG